MILSPYYMSYRTNVPEGTANTMKLTILGATGATGTTLTGQALAAGHEVTAVVRDPARLGDPACTFSPPPSLTDNPATGASRTAIDRTLPHGFTVSRADLAACMLASLSDPATVHRHVAIAS